MATIPDPVDVLDFKMKQLCRFRVTDQRYEIQDTSALVATSHLYGLVFVGTPDKVKIIKVADLVQIDNSSSKKTEISSYPFKEILLPSRPTFVALSSDNLTLIVCIQKSGCPVGWLYDVRGFARQAGDWNPFQEVRLSSTEGTIVRDCAWNPTTPGLVAVILSDGSLVEVEIKNTQFTINSLPPSTGAQAISWSPKGKQLVVARPGKLVQYKPDLKEAKTIPFSGSDDVHMSQPAVCGLQWLSTSQFLVTFIDESDSNSRPHLHIVNVQKSGATIFVDYDDVCYGNPSERPHKYLTLGIPQWNVLLACSANAMEIAVLGQTGVGGPEHPEWRQWTLEGECRAELPLDQNDETKPMGMAIDTTSQIPIPWDDNQTLSPVPILFVLSTHGLLCPFHVLNLASGVPSVNEPPQQLSAANERPALSGIGLKAAQAVPLAASTPLPSSAKAAIPRTNLGERFAAFAETPSLAAAAKPLPPSGASTESFFANKPPAQSFPPPLTTIKTVQVPAPIVPPIKIAEVSPAVPKPTPAPVKLTNETAVEESSSMGAAAAILRDEVAKFVQDLKEFKARSSTLKVSVASDEEKHRLLKMTSELAKFGVELVETTKIQDEEVRGLCTDLDEVAALLEDARVLYARRKNSRYSHLLKLRPLDPANRRKLDGIERLHAHIEQQLVEASYSLDSINRDRTRDQNRKIEIPITQVICEAIKNNAKVISQLKSKVERIKTQSKEQQLKLAGAAFEALRPKASDESRKWESELAVLADSLLTSRIRGDGENQSNHPVIPQVSPEKQAMLRSVLACRPVARIRAVRPESVAESRLLSNLSGLIHSEDKKDNSFSSSTVVSQAPTKSGLFSSAGSNVYVSSQESKTQLPKMGINNAGLATSVSTSSSRITDPKHAPRAAASAAAEVEDITPPSSPLNLEQKAKALGNQQMISSLSLPSLVQAPNVEETKPAISFANVDVKPVVSLPTSLPPPYAEPSKPTFSIRPASNPPSYESKPAFSLPTSTPVLSFGTPKSDTQTGLGSANLFGKSSFASVFTAATTATTATIAPTPTKTTLATSTSFASFGTPVPTSTVPVTPVKPQPTSAVAPTPSFSFANPPASSTPAASVAIPITTNPTEGIPTLKTSFSFNSLTSASVAPTASPTTVPDPALPQAPTPISTSAVVTTSVTNAVAPTSTFSFSSTSLPSTASLPTAVIAAPFSFTAPQSSSSTSCAPTNALETKPAAAPTSFSFSLAKTPNSSSTSAPGAAPFSFSSSGTGSTSASATPSVFPAPNLTPATGSLFSLTSSAKAPTAFGVVNVTTPISTSPSTSLFGQVPGATIAATAPTLFGQPVSTPATTPDAGLSSLFGQSKLGNSIAAAAPATQSTLGQIASVASVASVASTTTPSSTPLFGRPVTTTTTGNTTGTLFGQPSAATTAGPFSSSFGQSVFGQPAAATSTPANVPVFGQATFGKPAQTTPQTIEVPAASSFGSSAFGQSSGTSTGFSAGTVFGQGGASTTTPVKPLFGGSAFGQTPTNTSVTSPTSNVSFGSGSVFGNIGLGGAPSAANANRNAFGGGTVFGVTPSAQGTFGSTAVSSPFGGQTVASAASAPPAFGSPTSTGFGAFGQSQPAFGGAATFGGSPQFGNKPTFGGGATFGSPVASIPASKPEAGGFGAFAAASNVPTFGVLASSGNAQPAFGGAAFPSNNPPSFGGGSSFSSWR